MVLITNLKPKLKPKSPHTHGKEKLLELNQSFVFSIDCNTISYMTINILKTVWENVYTSAFIVLSFITIKQQNVDLFLTWMPTHSKGASSSVLVILTDTAFFM